MSARSNPIDELVQVLIDRPTRALDRPFTYRVPRRLRSQVAPGSYVLVPFGKQNLPGFVLGSEDEPPEAELKEILDALAPEPLIDEDQLQLARWVAQRYMAPLLDAVRLVTPPGATRQIRRTVRLVGPALEPEELEQWKKRAPARARVIEALQACGGEASVGELERRTRRKVSSVLRALREKGLVEDRRALQPPTARERTELVVRLLRNDLFTADEIAALEKRAPRRAAAVRALREAGGELTRGELEERGKIALAALRALEEQGWIALEERSVQRDPLAWHEPSTSGPAPTELSGAQQAALDVIRGQVEQRRIGPVLLHGVTGSGKTEVYLRAMAQVVAEGRGAIMLVPEIALTPQLVARFRQQFPDELVLLHSGLSAGERFDGWERLRRGEASVCVGARSAVFGPVANIGLIVVDEEQEAAYKQEQSPRYDARTVAERRAEAHGATLVFGSATPSVEAYYAATEGKTSVLAELPERIDGRPLPEVEIIDMREARDEEDPDWPFSPLLEEWIEATLDAGEQVILLLNRRGFSTFVLCRECGASLRCPDCDVSLTFHFRTKQMRCHHCDYARPVPEVCDACEGVDVGFLGTGTEKLEDQVRRRFAAARPLRLDSDVTTRKGAHARILGEFASGEANVLLGTQMVAKGLDFPGVTLVGVISGDTGLSFPDFRAAERTFQLITQAAGRAGRGDRPGRVVIQTFNPDHYAITAASEHDYNAFFEIELDSRRGLTYPPFAVLIDVKVSDRSLRRAEGLATKIAEQASEVAAESEDVQVLGPAPAPLERLRGRYRWRVLLKCPALSEGQLVWDQVQERLEPKERASLIVDVDPQNMM